MLLAAVTALVATAPQSARADAAGDTITSDGPLTVIRTSADLNCSVNRVGDVDGEFYGDTACATLAAVDGTLYGPANIPAGGNAAPRTTWTQVAQTSSGAGTAINPYRIVTNVSGGPLKLAQTDTYVVGSESYATRVAITNDSDSAKTVTLYRAGDCYLFNDDTGYGATDHDAGSVSCVNGREAGSRIEQWAPLTAGSHFIESYYGSVWAAVGTQSPFPDTCLCGADDERHDDGAGLSWTVTISPGTTQSFSHLTAFSPTGTANVSDSDGDGFPDTWETPDGGVDTDGDGKPDVKLADYGATPDKPDVFVQVDSVYDKSCFLIFFCHTTPSRRPSLAALRDVENAFKARGVRLHIDAGPDSVMNPDTGAKWGALAHGGGGVGGDSRIAGDGSGGFDWTAAFDGYRDKLLPAERSRLFHFALYVGDFNANGNSGLARVDQSTSFAGRDLIFAYDIFGAAGPSRLEEAGTFMHELGHNLGLTHGGTLSDQGINYKPNYPSVMNYSWQFSGVSRDGTLGHLDYSLGTLDSIDETSLSEQDGLGPDDAAKHIGTRWACPGGAAARVQDASDANVDWNCSGRINDAAVSANVNDIDHDTPDLGVLRDNDDWTSLIFDGGGAIGGAGDAAGAAPAKTAVDQEVPVADLRKVAGDLETVQLSGPGSLSIQSHTSAPVELTLANRRSQSRTYDLSAIARGVEVESLPEHVTLAAGETRTLRVILKAGDADAAAFFEIDAGSDDLTDQDSATTSVAVVDQAVADQPPVTAPPAATPQPPGSTPAPPTTPAARAKAALTVLDDTGRAITAAVDGGRASSVRGVGASVPVAAGAHTVTIAYGKRTAKVKLTLAPRELGALVVTARNGRPSVRVVRVAAGKRVLLSLLSGTRRVGTAKVRHGATLPLAASVKTVTVGGVKLRPGAQLTVLATQGRRVVAVSRTAG